MTQKYQYLQRIAVNSRGSIHNENGEGMNEAFGSCISKHLKLDMLMITIER